MSDYISEYTGEQIDTAVGNVASVKTLTDFWKTHFDQANKTDSDLLALRKVALDGATSGTQYSTASTVTDTSASANQTAIANVTTVKSLIVSESDNAPTSGSNKPVKSKGVYTALQGKQDALESGTNIKTINNESLLGSGNITISSGSSYATMTSTDITNSNTTAKVVTGKLLHDQLAAKQNTLYLLDSDQISRSSETAKSVNGQVLRENFYLKSETYTKAQVETALAGKQATLTFDSAPVSGSSNPVTSGGVFTALSGKASKNGSSSEAFNASSLTTPLIDIKEGSYIADITYDNDDFELLIEESHGMVTHIPLGGHTLATTEEVDAVADVCVTITKPSTAWVTDKNAKEVYGLLQAGSRVYYKYTDSDGVKHDYKVVSWESNVNGLATTYRVYAVCFTTLKMSVFVNSATDMAGMVTPMNSLSEKYITTAWMEEHTTQESGMQSEDLDVALEPNVVHYCNDAADLVAISINGTYDRTATYELYFTCNNSRTLIGFNLGSGFNFANNAQYSPATNRIIHVTIRNYIIYSDYADQQ